MALRAEIEERIIDFLEIDHIRHAPVSALSHLLRAWNWRGRWRCGPRC